MLSDTVTIRSNHDMSIISRIVHPKWGDITEEVTAALNEENQKDHERLLATADQRQAAIAAATPGPARIANGFALKAQIDPAIVAYWRMREGPGFWKHELDWFLKRHPECRVRRQTDQPTVRMAELPAYRVRGKRGRWAA